MLVSSTKESLKKKTQKTKESLKEGN